MFVKKAVVLGMAVVLLSGLCAMPVSAHGRHHRQSEYRTENTHLCEVCSVEGCMKMGWHVHDDVTYCGYDHADGYCDGTCNTAVVCTLAQCTETGHHIHDGKNYCSYDHESGYCDGTCDSVTVCAVAGCVKTGRHTHNGETYCGYDHADGYCDGICVRQESSGTRRSGRHHGCHM